MGRYQIFSKENTKLNAFGLSYNAGMLSPCNLHVYHNATRTKEERTYASVSIGSKIWMVSLYDSILLYDDESPIFCLIICLKSQSTSFQSCREKIFCFHRLNQYLAGDKAPCSGKKHSDPTGSESQTSKHSIPNIMLYQLSHCAPPKIISNDTWDLW